MTSPTLLRMSVVRGSPQVPGEMVHPVADEFIPAILPVFHQIAALQHHPAPLAVRIEPDGAQPVRQLQRLALDLNRELDGLFRLDPPGPTRERRWVALEEIGHGCRQLLGEGLAKGAGGQCAPPLDARQPLRPHRLDCFTPVHCPGLGADQLLVELPALEGVESEGLLIFASRVFQLEGYLEPLLVKGLDRGLQKVGQVPEGEGLLSLQGGKGGCPGPAASVAAHDPGVGRHSWA